MCDAGHAGGDFRVWGADRTRHSVHAVQEGLTHLGWATVVDGLYGPQTRAAVAGFQVQARGARKDTAASGGVVGVNDFLHLTAACSQRVGREHRARFLY